MRAHRRQILGQHRKNSKDSILESRKWNLMKTRYFKNAMKTTTSQFFKILIYITKNLKTTQLTSDILDPRKLF